MMIPPSLGFSILRTRDIVNLMTKSDKNSVIPLSKLDGGEGSLPPQRVVVRVAPKHLPLISLRISPANQDNILIATSAGSLLLYKAHHLWKQGPRQGQGQGGTTHSIEPPFKIFDLLLDHSSSFSIYDFAPNPEAFPDICAVLFSSGSLSLVNLDSGSISSTSTNITDPQHPLYAAAGQDGGNGVISAINWSKKGKQLAVGTKSGSILQITPDDAFTVKNEIPPPPSEDAIPVSYLVKRLVSFSYL